MIVEVVKKNKIRVKTVLMEIFYTNNVTNAINSLIKMDYDKDTPGLQIKLGELTTDFAKRAAGIIPPLAMPIMHEKFCSDNLSAKTLQSS